MIEQRVFGKMPSGEQIDEYTLTNAKGLSLKVITYGGIVTQLHVPDQRGRLDDVVLGFDRLEPYLAGHPYFGCITGRVAGRVTGGKFSLGGKDYTLAINDPPNHLHGGRTGFDKRVWRVESVTEEKRGARLTLGYHSPDGELVNYSTRTNIQVANLAISHLSVGQTNRFAKGNEFSIRVVLI